MLKKKYTTSDYLLDFLKEKKIKKVFLLTGGAIAFVVDSFSKRKDIGYICVQHEQAAAMMADAYSRVGPNFAATMSTSGPGATNLITGIACSYFDSIPNIHITGQVNTHEQIGAMLGTKKSRQIGFQETNIVSITQPITKKSLQLRKAEDIQNILEYLYNLSQDGRQGPVLLDIPMDMQRVEIKRKSLKVINKTYSKKKVLESKNTNKIIQLLERSLRPVIISGGGIRYSKSVKVFNKLVTKLKVPIVTTWSGIDTIDYNNKYYIGHIGVYGSRSGNFTIQNSDLILSLGSRLDTRITSTRPSTFGRKAKLIMVDVDKGELSKRRGLRPFIEINCDAGIFVEKILYKL